MKSKITLNNIVSSSPFKYSLSIIKEEKGYIKFYIKDIKGKPLKNFDKHVSQDKCPKIYIALKQNVPIYVGYTHQRMATRLRQGLNSKYCYFWKCQKKVELLVWVFTIESQIEEYKRLMESIEGEIVFNIRNQKDGRWPEHQQEIHFGNERPEEVRKIAKSICSHLMLA